MHKPVIWADESFELMEKHYIQNQVDILLYEEGSFAPLSWLLKEALLDYADYQAWRNGEMAYLEPCLKNSKEVVIANLQIAQQYASALKLDAMRQTYLSASGQLLSFSPSDTRERIYTCVFEPGKQRVQMDLFFDSAASNVTSELITAIINNQAKQITALLNRLKPLDNEQVIQYKKLLVLREKFITHNGKQKMQLLEQQISPLAFELLGRQTHDFLVPLWQKLSDQIEEKPFNADDSEYHLSYIANKSMQWQKVLHSISREADWQNQPLLLFRYAEACFKLHKELQGLELWYRLILLFPTQAEQWLEKSVNHILTADWHAFEELEPELDTECFPAWLLLQRPALAKHDFLFDFQTPGIAALKLIRKLLVSTAGKGLSESEILLRSELKTSNPQLFEHFMRVSESKSQPKTPKHGAFPDSN